LLTPPSPTTGIVGELWRVSDDEQTSSWLFTEAQKCLSPTDPPGNLAALYLFHRVMIDGPPQSLKEISSKQSFFEGMKKSATAQLTRDKVFAKRIMLYADFLEKKCALHAKHPEFEGTYSLDVFFFNFQKLPPSQRKMTFFKYIILVLSPESFSVAAPPPPPCSFLLAPTSCGS